MAYVTVTWNYGDTTLIDGFRVYRDGILRFETTDKDLRTYDDDITGFGELRTTYTVVAFDQFKRESTKCSKTDVELTYSLTPIMTGQNTPSGEATISATDCKVTEEAWEFFNEENKEPKIDRNGYAPANWTMRWRYKFSSKVSVSRWSYLSRDYTCCGEFTGEGLELRFYGLVGDIRTMLGSTPISLGKPIGQETSVDTDGEQLYDSFEWELGSINGVVNDTPAFFNFFGTLRLYGKPV